MPAVVEDIEFDSHGTTCRAWVLRAPVDGDAPCVVMGHGFGATRHCSLVRYARHFNEHGLHCLIFDYRHFGDSDGQPRQVLSLRRQLEDWQRALETARALEGVDPSKLVAWGSSLGGGHSLIAGVRDGRVAAVVSQCPLMDGLSAYHGVIQYAGLGTVVRITARGVADLLGSLVGAEPLRLPIAGPVGSIGIMTSPDAVPGYAAIAPPDFRNEVAARIAVELAFYRPIDYASALRCPMLMLVCDRDAVAPPEPAYEVHRRAAHLVEMHRYPIGHFDIYQDEHYQDALERMVAFFDRCL